MLSIYSYIPNRNIPVNSSCIPPNQIIPRLFYIPLYSPRFAWEGRPHRRFFWPTQTYIQKILQKHYFFSVFTFFSVKNAVIYTFFGLKSVQNTGFCSVFNALASKNHSKYRYLQCFFISVRFSLAGSRPK